MNSMTGYGKSERSLDGRKLRVEIKSVNNRYLDINIRLPRLLMRFEDLIRNDIKKYISRGRVDVYIGYASECADSKTITVNWALINAYLEAARKISCENELDNDISVSKLLELPEVIIAEENNNDDEIIKELLNRTVADALSELNSTRKSEGNRLMEDINGRIRQLNEIILNIQKSEHIVVEEYRKKLCERLNEALENRLVDETRLMQEVAIFADKANITEEIVRIKSHLTQFGQLTGKPGPLGKNMDFLVQELNREFNTIGSKAQYIYIIKDVISAKGELEKIREQIQNVE